MKILYLHQHFRGPDEAGGTRSYEFARRWTCWGHEVHIITTRQSGGEAYEGWQQKQLAGIHIHQLCVSYSNEMGFLRRVRAFLAFAVRACRRATHIGGDAVFATSTPLTIAIPGIWASRRLRIPLVFEVRDLWPEVPIAMGVIRSKLLIWLSQGLERLAYKNSSYIIALSPGMATGIERVGLGRDKVVVIPNACDTALFQNGSDKCVLDACEELLGRKIVLYAGTLGDVNGIDYLLDIARAMLAYDDMPAFVIFGEGKHLVTLQERASKESLAGRNVFFFPPVPKRMMPGILEACDVAVSFVIDVEALWNNSANKFFDALAAGKPVAINHRGWLAELIEKHGIGVVLPPDDSRTAAKLLLDFLRNPDRVRSASQGAFELANSMFDRDLLARKALTVLERARDGGATA